MILPAHQEELGTVRRTTRPHIVERLVRVPVERLRNPVALHLEPDHIATIRGLSGVQREKPADRRIRRDDHLITRDTCSMVGVYDLLGGPALQTCHAGAAEHACAGRGGRGRQAAREAYRIELGLIQESQLSSRPARERHGHPLDGDACGFGSAPFELEGRGIVREQEAVESREIALDRLAFDQSLRPLDGGPMARRRERSELAAVHRDQRSIPTIERSDEMRGAAFGFASPAGDRRIVQYDDVVAAPG